VQGKKAYARLTLDLARQAKNDLARSASLDRQAAVAQALASAARLAGNDDLAAKAEAELAAIDRTLDDEYRAKVPPFKPDLYAGREDPEHDRVVVLELFTGSECPPCIAADVGFDALLATYKPTELIALQYHTNIAGPDPLTNPASGSRAAFYGIGGTPSTYFNGLKAAGGGGGMDVAKLKYDHYREQIDQQLAGKKSANIELQLTRSGAKIAVNAAAQTENKAGAKFDAESKLRLRVALTEREIRFVGGNRLWFHHHVVRGLPGGVEGTPLVAGEGKVELTIDLEELRDQLGTQLDGFAKESHTTAIMPKIELKHLAVVVFVQDDGDKRILHAVEAAVPGAE
jgi:hypothetical protein